MIVEPRERDVRRECEEALAPLLQPGETVLWAGRPKRGLILRGSDLLAIPIAIAYLVFLAYLVDAAVRGDGAFAAIAVILRSFLPDQDQMLALTGFQIDLVLIVGLSVLALLIYRATIGSFILHVRTRRGTVYGITDKRVIILPGHAPSLATAYPLRRLPDVRVEHHHDGEATIRLNPYSPVGPIDSDVDVERIPPVFDHVPDGDKVFAILTDAVAKARAS